MCRTIKIESSCPRCHTPVTQKKKPGILGFTYTGLRYPKPFKKYNHTWLCPECRKQAEENWNNFMLTKQKTPVPK